MATAELTVIGLGRTDPSAGEYIAEIQRRLAAQERVRYKLQAMGTELEGSTEDIQKVAIMQGMLRLRDDGLRKVGMGQTCLEEIFRVVA